MSAQGSTLLLLLAALIGLFIGLLLSSLSSGKEGKRKSQPPPEILKEGYGEVARLWYSPGTKKILTEMDGGFYKSVNGLSGEQKAKLKRLIALLNEWLGAEPPVETTPQATVVENTHYQPLPDPVSRENAYSPQQLPAELWRIRITNRCLTPLAVKMTISMIKKKERPLLKLRFLLSCPPRKKKRM